MRTSLLVLLTGLISADAQTVYQSGKTCCEEEFDGWGLPKVGNCNKVTRKGEKNVVGLWKDVSKARCHKYCRDDDNCQFFEWSSSKKKCYIATNPSQCQAFHSSSGYNIYKPDCPGNTYEDNDTRKWCKDEVGGAPKDDRFCYHDSKKDCKCANGKKPLSHNDHKCCDVVCHRKHFMAFKPAGETACPYVGGAQNVVTHFSQCNCKAPYLQSSASCYETSYPTSAPTPSPTPPEPCVWSEWSAWTNDAKTCNSNLYFGTNKNPGRRTKYRSIISMPKYGGTPCHQWKQLIPRYDPDLEFMVKEMKYRFSPNLSGKSFPSNQIFTDKGCVMTNRTGFIDNDSGYGTDQRPGNEFHFDYTNKMPKETPTKMQCVENRALDFQNEKAKYGGSADLSCVLQDCPCEFSNWNKNYWGDVGKSCGIYKHRTRSLITAPYQSRTTNPKCQSLARDIDNWQGYIFEPNKAPVFHKAKCSQSSCPSCTTCTTNSQTEYKLPCPIDCKVSGWSRYGSCSKTCGTGFKRRTRSVFTAASDGGVGCPTLSSSTSCETFSCPIDCKVSGWSGYAPCTKTCGIGSKTKTRSVVNTPFHGGVGCLTLSSSTTCNTFGCPIDCKVSSWSAYGPCTKSCATGSKTRTRSIINTAFHGGVVCPTLSSSATCNVQACPTPLPTPSPTKFPTTKFPTPSPTKAPTAAPMRVCPDTYCTYVNGGTTVFTKVYDANHERWHCEKKGNGCECLCHNSFDCVIRHHHISGYKRSLNHCDGPYVDPVKKGFVPPPNQLY